MNEFTPNSKMLSVLYTVPNEMCVLHGAQSERGIASFYGFVCGGGGPRNWSILSIYIWSMCKNGGNSV